MADRSSSMIALKAVLLMLVVVGLSSQPIRPDSAAVVAARSRRSVRMPGAAQDAAGQSSAGIRRQALAAVLHAADADAEGGEPTRSQAIQRRGTLVHQACANETDSQQQICTAECDSQKHIWGS